MFFVCGTGLRPLINYYLTFKIKSSHTRIKRKLINILIIKEKVIE